MKRRYGWALALILVLIMAAACTPSGAEPGAPAAGETPQMDTPTPEDEDAEEIAAEALPAALEALASFLNVAPGAVELDRIEDAEWSDSCLGLGGPAEICAEAITPGYLITFTVDGSSYAVRTDLEGREVRVEAAAGQPGGEEGPAAVTAAIEALAAQLGVDASTIEVLESSEEEWTDSCLGLGGPAESCAAVITPGWRVMLGAEGQDYEVHTDVTGEQVRIAGEPSGEERPSAVKAAVEALARRLEGAVDSIEVLSFTETEWSDSCLGLGGPAESCAAVMTPGWEVILGVGDEVYEVRTDASGAQVRIADETMGEAEPGAAPEPALEGAVLFLQRSGGIMGDVTTVRVYEDGTVERTVEGPDPVAGVETSMVEPAAVQTLLEELASAGYFDLERSYLPEDTCCDRFLYLVSVEGEEGQHTVEALADAEDTPPALAKSVDLIETFIGGAFEAVQ